MPLPSYTWGHSEARLTPEQRKQLADWAEKDRNALLCQLNSYPHPKQEVVA